jgi:hypothetical protein
MELRRGTVRAFDSGTYRATVQLAGSLPTYLEAVPVARNIADGEMLVGRSCAVALFDPANPGDAVVAAVWT